MLHRIFSRVSRQPLVVAENTQNRILNDILSLCQDPSLIEIYVSADGIFNGLTKDQTRVDLSIRLSSEEVLDLASDLAANSMVRLDPYKPFAGGVIAELKWRWHAVTPPLSPDGPILVLRRQQFSAINLENFHLLNFDSEMIPKWLAEGNSLVIFGGTGCGKTSLLMTILRDLFMQHRVGIAESVQEIPLLSPNWFRLVETAKDTGGRGGMDFERVVAEMMRLSPDTLVIGELRSLEARFLPEFARTGHGGVLTTLHAGSFDFARARLSRLAQEPIRGMPPIIGLHIFRDGPKAFCINFERMN